MRLLLYFVALWFVALFVLQSLPILILAVCGVLFRTAYLLVRSLRRTEPLFQQQRQTIQIVTTGYNVTITIS